MTEVPRDRNLGPLLLWLVLLLAGCGSLSHHDPTPSLPPLPSKKEIRAGQYVFITDVDLKQDDPLLKDLERLQEQVCKELQIPPGSNLVHVYLFSNRQKYQEYMEAAFKSLPSRRAFFMARADDRGGQELLVYTYWGDRIREDLRHELTHALLHSVLRNVPLWLDEGLAEFFETPPEWHGLNYRHLAGFRSQPGIPWTPNLARLERLALVKDMGPADYRESWAWVHFMLRGNQPQARTVLLNYLQQLRGGKQPLPFELQLAAAVVAPETALRQHLAAVETATRQFPAVTASGPGFP